MTPELLAIINTIIAAAGGVAAKGLIDRAKEARGRRLDEAQRIAAQRDEARTEREQARTEAARLRRCKQEWEYTYHRLRVIALRHGVPESEIPPPPDHH